jgi:hypothetical protein
MNVLNSRTEDVSEDESSTISKNEHEALMDFRTHQR